jgi:dephospho-CoA kinase
VSEEPFVLGLTGSIGMGKSTVARMFREEGIPVWDADGAVHRLYARGGDGVAQIAALRPEAVQDGQVSRPALRAWIAEDPGALERIERAIHPLVAADRSDFLAGADAADEPLVVLDIPLLFETGGERFVDAVLVVTAPPELQRERVLARPGITEADLERMLAKQMSDAEKRARADFIIQSIELEPTRQSIQALIVHLRERDGDA